MGKVQDSSPDPLIVELESLSGERRWSQKELAKELKSSQSVISRILGGKTDDVGERTMERLRRGVKEIRDPFEQLLEAKKTLKEKLQALKDNSRPATVVFFDLVASTKFRRVHGSVEGFRKARQHNFLVSEAIRDQSGDIVKWSGASVMAMFLGEVEGVVHPIRALKAGLGALTRIQKWNKGISDSVWDRKIQTKVGLSTGDVHLLSVKTEDGKKELTKLDPMGSTVDLAARLESLAMPDTILIDRYTFWGGEFEDLKSKTTPICTTPESDLNRNEESSPNLDDGQSAPITETARQYGWRELQLDRERETTYLPQAAPFLLRDTGLELLQVGGADSPIPANEFAEQAIDIKNAKGSLCDIPLVFACEPVDCNIAGFQNRVEAVSVSFEAQQKPIKQAVYESPSGKHIQNLLCDADELHCHGDEEAAKAIYEQILKEDPRDFRANVRLAQYWRRKNKKRKAGRFWNEAKKSNPDHGMIWALAGATHLEIYIVDNIFPTHGGPVDQRDIDKHRDSSITEFTRARQLAAESFDYSLEQLCACCLVICHAMRMNESDLLKAGDLVHELTHWTPSTRQLAILQQLAKANYYTVAEGRHIAVAREALDVANALFDDRDSQPPRPLQLVGGQPDAPVLLRNDALLERQDFSLLIDVSRIRLKIAEQGDYEAEQGDYEFA